MRRIALVNQKGGCGKTITAINLSSSLAAKGRKVLLIDLDPQGHSAMGLGVAPVTVEKSIYEVLIGESTIEEAVISVRDNLDIVCSDVVLSAFEQVMSGEQGRELKLAKCTEGIQSKYDYLILDCPPSVGLITINGLMAASEVIIPVDPSYFSIDGVEKQLETIRVLAKKTGHHLSAKILANNIDRRTKFCREMAEFLKTTYPDNCFRTVINTCTALREAAGLGIPLVEHNKDCIAFRDFTELTRETMSPESEIEVDTSIIEFLLQNHMRQEDMEHGKVLFSMDAPENAEVCIAGDFNNWVPEPLNLINSGGKVMWCKTIPLKPGSYAYKYVVNDKWIADPKNENFVDDLCGGRNSIINI